LDPGFTALIAFVLFVCFLLFWCVTVCLHGQHCLHAAAAAGARLPNFSDVAAPAY